jgi:hypothetical protein
MICCTLGACSSVNAQEISFSPSAYNVGSGPTVAVADVNGDGRLDLIAANSTTNTLTVLTNDGTGGFGFNASLNVGKNPGWVLAIDVYGDAKVHLVCCNDGDNTITVLTNNGSGIFSSNATLTVGNLPQPFVAADINGDGYMDVISPNYTTPGTLTVYTNNGFGRFGTNTTLTVGSYPACLCTADVNRDGYVDLISASYKGNNANTLTVLTNRGNGVCGFNARLSVGRAPMWVSATDVNGDGCVDLVTANNGTNTLTVLTNNGKGIFGFNATLISGGTPVCIAAADLNGDGKLDLVSANGGIFGLDPGHGNSVTVFTNDGSGVFGSNTRFAVGVGAINLLAADINADGRADLITANYYDNTVTVLRNTTTFPPAMFYPRLSIEQRGENLRVSWPSASPGWSLQEKTSLTSPNWLPSGYEGFPISDNGATYPLADDGTNMSLTLPASARSLFFRLLHP